MPSNSTMGDDVTVRRRRVLQAIGAATTVGLAGCGDEAGTGDSDSDSDADSDADDSTPGGGGDLGERVPTLVFNYWSDQGAGTVVFEETISQIEAHIGDVGIDIEPEAMTTAESANLAYDDERTYHVGVQSNGPDPGRLDPDDLLTAHHIENAGANGRPNRVQYASCEYSELVDEQKVTVPESARREVVDSAFEVFSNDIPFIPTIERPATSAVNLDQVTELSPGEAGLSDIHWAAVLESEASARGDADAIVASLPSEFLTSSFYPTVADADALVLYTVLTVNPLLWYSSDYERVPILAEDWEESDDGTETTFTLRDGTFHNGDPITPEDVKWTYEFLNEQFQAGTYLHTRLPADLSVEVIDDETVSFQTDDPAPWLMTAALPVYGVLPRDPYVEAGIEDDPINFEDPMIGSGPYRISSYSNQESIYLEPHDGHPIFSPDTDIVATIYESVDGTVRAMQNGEINLAVALTPEAGQRLEENMNNVQIISGVAHVNYGLFPQMSFAPGNFREFRLALGHILDRQAINETYAFGDSEPATLVTFQSQYHPWHNGDVLTEAGGETADTDAARQVLEDAGWGWDDDGNLHYPPDAEMEAWPQGEEPSPDEFPCLE